MAQSVVLKRDLSRVVVEPDNDPPVQMGDPTVVVTEENKESARRLKSRAMESADNGELDEAINRLTEAVVLIPKSAVLFASRATVFLKLKKPNAAIRDANASLQINPDFGRGYKLRGIARMLLGLWEEAATDFDTGLKLDFDVMTFAMLYKGPKNMPSDGKKVIEVETAKEFETMLNAASRLSCLAVVYFTANWCATCRDRAPVFNELAVKHKKVAFFNVDVDKLKETSFEWGVYRFPSIFLWKGGEVLGNVADCNMDSLDKKIMELSV